MFSDRTEQGTAKFEDQQFLFSLPVYLHVVKAHEQALPLTENLTVQTHRTPRLALGKWAAAKLEPPLAKPSRDDVFRLPNLPDTLHIAREAENPLAVPLRHKVNKNLTRTYIQHQKCSSSWIPNDVPRPTVCIDGLSGHGANAVMRTFNLHEQKR